MTLRPLLLAGLLLAPLASAAQAAPAPEQTAQAAKACELRAFHSPPGRAHLWHKVGDCDSASRVKANAVEAENDKIARQQKSS